ncbi:alanine racemase [Photobacterium gaetbulicola]|uniref:Alanine racemase n=1 Tax=Photobacterium gaetbulicola TaxID=1295392 RepID=A0A0B9H291_9GAMM|nr:alanine racemase [Photobacterium gaetbulicola]KHT62947.1 alanine racemase [Photobacterium gaetbulicola]
MITAKATIDLKAIRHNYQVLNHKAGKQSLIVVIKGNAYGHGAVDIARALPQAERFAVARIEEALELRMAGITTPIVLLEGCFCLEDLAIAAEHKLETVIHNETQLLHLEQLSGTHKVVVWLKIDTGMHRVGVQPEEARDYISRIHRSGNIVGDIGFLSHFSCADDLLKTKTLKQIELFYRSIGDQPGPKSIANSAGILLWPESQFDWARTGISLYGIAPQSNHQGSEFNLLPAMTLTTKLISIRPHKSGEPAGYGDSWVSRRNTFLGVVAIGYGDGYPRSASNRSSMFINGRSVSVVGRVSMDMVIVDLGPDSKDQIGDEVEVWGKHIPIETVAKSANTIPYELVILLTNRVYRETVG